MSQARTNAQFRAAASQYESQDGSGSADYDHDRFVEQLAGSATFRSETISNDADAIERAAIAACDAQQVAA